LDRIKELRDAIDSRFDRFDELIDQLREKQSQRDKQCATEQANTDEMRRQLRAVWEKMDNGTQCKTCQNATRVAALELNAAVQDTKLKWMKGALAAVATALLAAILKIATDWIHQAQTAKHASVASTSTHGRCTALQSFLDSLI
jgi:uncharacterized coiled-coil protein SlyX